MSQEQFENLLRGINQKVSGGSNKQLMGSTSLSLSSTALG